MSEKLVLNNFKIILNNIYPIKEKGRGERSDLELLPFLLACQQFCVNKTLTLLRLGFLSCQSKSDAALNLEKFLTIRNIT